MLRERICCITNDFEKDNILKTKTNLEISELYIMRFFPHLGSGHCRRDSSRSRGQPGRLGNGCRRRPPLHSCRCRPRSFPLPRRRGTRGVPSPYLERACRSAVPPCVLGVKRSSLFYICIAYFTHLTSHEETLSYFLTSCLTHSARPCSALEPTMTWGSRMIVEFPDSPVTKVYVELPSEPWMNVRM